ncbi:MAG: hypothetical protein Q4D21_07490 [Phascolarctobacterium sp.]|nr:hypothetical protein [Phascolarctobacterium sp.]
MHKHQTKIKAFALALAFVLLASFCVLVPHNSEAVDAPTKTTKQELKKNISKDKKAEDKKQAKKTEDKKTDASKPADNIEKKPESKPTPPPAPVTPDKKKYASPNGYQRMTDGREINFRSAGVIYMHGYRYTYYSSRALYHHNTHNWYACDDHIYRTADGYVVVAAKGHAQGSIVPTPFGPGKVLDYCYIDGTIDIYVDF